MHAGEGDGDRNPRDGEKRPAWRDRPVEQEADKDIKEGGMEGRHPAPEKGGQDAPE